MKVSAAMVSALNQNLESTQPTSGLSWKVKSVLAASAGLPLIVLGGPNTAEAQPTDSSGAEPTGSLSPTARTDTPDGVTDIEATFGNFLPAGPGSREENGFTLGPVYEAGPAVGVGSVLAHTDTAHLDASTRLPTDETPGSRAGSVHAAEFEGLDGAGSSLSATSAGVGSEALPPTSSAAASEPTQVRPEPTRSGLSHLTTAATLGAATAASNAAGKVPESAKAIASIVNAAAQQTGRGPEPETREPETTVATATTITDETEIAPPRSETSRGGPTSSNPHDSGTNSGAKGDSGSGNGGDGGSGNGGDSGSGNGGDSGSGNGGDSGSGGGDDGRGSVSPIDVTVDGGVVRAEPSGPQNLKILVDRSRLGTTVQHAEEISSPDGVIQRTTTQEPLSMMVVDQIDIAGSKYTDSAEVTGYGVTRKNVEAGRWSQGANASGQSLEFETALTEGDIMTLVQLGVEVNGIRHTFEETSTTGNGPNEKGEIVTNTAAGTITLTQQKSDESSFVRRSSEESFTFDGSRITRHKSSDLQVGAEGSLLADNVEFVQGTTGKILDSAGFKSSGVPVYIKVKSKYIVREDLEVEGRGNKQVVRETTFHEEQAGKIAVNRKLLTDGKLTKEWEIEVDRANGRPKTATSRITYAELDPESGQPRNISLAVLQPHQAGLSATNYESDGRALKFDVHITAGRESVLKDGSQRFADVDLATDLIIPTSGGSITLDDRIETTSEDRPGWGALERSVDLGNWQHRTTAWTNTSTDATDSSVASEDIQVEPPNEPEQLQGTTTTVDAQQTLLTKITPKAPHAVARIDTDGTITQTQHTPPTLINNARTPKMPSGHPQGTGTAEPNLAPGVYKQDDTGDEVVYGTPADDVIVVDGRRRNFFGGWGDYRVTINGELHFIEDPDNLQIKGLGGDDIIYGGPKDDTIYPGPGNNKIIDARGSNTYVSGNPHDAQGITDGPSDFVAAPFNQRQFFLFQLHGMKEGRIVTPNTDTYQKTMKAIEMLDLMGQPDSSRAGRSALDKGNIFTFRSCENRCNGMTYEDNIGLAEPVSFQALVHEIFHLTSDDNRFFGKHGEAGANAAGLLAASIAGYENQTVEQMKGSSLLAMSGNFYKERRGDATQADLQKIIDATFAEAIAIAKMPPEMRSKLRY